MPKGCIQLGADVVSYHRSTSPLAQHIHTFYAYINGQMVKSWGGVTEGIKEGFY